MHLELTPFWVAQEQQMTTRNHMLRVRFSDAEWTALKLKAEEADMTMSELIRNHLGKVKLRNRSDEKKRVAMLNRINANLNMIARWVNTHKNAASTVEVVSHLIAIEKAIEEVSG